MRIHIVSFQNPYPPDYGGAIDVFFKIKALKERGIKVVLHTFYYGGRNPRQELEAFVEKVYYYPRKRSIKYFLSPIPFIVRSRQDKKLLERLANVSDNEPIFFEGLHTTGWISHPSLRNKMKWVRCHNVEHDYYRLLARGTQGWGKRTFLLSESIKLRWYESNLRHADLIFPISDNDMTYFSTSFPDQKIKLLPCFFDDTPEKESHPDSTNPDGLPSPYILYNGNLEVEENIRSVRYIVRDILPRIKENMHMVIAGKNPTREIMEMAASDKRITVVANPPGEVMNSLIADAAIHYLFTFQSTGIKLKLLNTLVRAKGHIIANTPMLNDRNLAGLCNRADTPEETISLTSELLRSPMTQEMLDKRMKKMRRSHSNASSVNILIKALEGTIQARESQL